MAKIETGASTAFLFHSRHAGRPVRAEKNVASTPPALKSWQRRDVVVVALEQTMAEGAGPTRVQWSVRLAERK